MSLRTEGFSCYIIKDLYHLCHPLAKLNGFFNYSYFAVHVIHEDKTVPHAMVKRISGYELTLENLFKMQSKRPVHAQKKMVVPKLNKGDLVKEVAAVFPLNCRHV